MSIRKVVVGEELFKFVSFQQWANKASSWFKCVRKYIALDEKGRVLMTGAEFMRARDDNSFPVRVYSVELAPKETEEALDTSDNPSSLKLPDVKEVVDGLCNGGVGHENVNYLNGIHDCHQFIAGKIGR